MSLFHFGDTAEHGHGHGTFVEELDPRVKLVGAVATAAWIGLVPDRDVGLVGLLGLGTLVVGGLAQIPPRVLIVRSSAALPFVVLPAVLGLLGGSFDPHHTAAMAIRGYATAMVATLLVSVTPYATILAAASALGVPDLLVQTTALVYRYLVVLRERASAMTASAVARGYGRQTPERFAKGGSMLGALLVRSLDRSERVHRSMLARGYTGRFPLLVPMRMRPTDWAAVAGFAAVWGGTLLAMLRSSA